MDIQQIKTMAQIDSWVDFTARVVEVKEQKLRGKSENQRMMTKCKLTDSSGETIGAWIEGTAIIGSVYTLSAMLCEYNNNKYIDWARIKYTHPAQGGSNAPPSASQTPQNAPQSTNSYEDREKAKNECICRQCAGKAAAEVVAAYIRALPKDQKYDIPGAISDLLTISDAMSIWFINGNQPKQQQDDDIPF